MDTTEEGMVTEVKCVNPLNTLFGNLVTLSPIVIVNKSAVEALNKADVKSPHDVALYETFAREVQP